MTALYLFAFLLLAACWVLILGVGAGIGWGVYLAARWLWRLYRAHRNQRAFEAWMEEAYDDAQLGQGMRAAERFGLLGRDFK